MSLSALKNQEALLRLEASLYEIDQSICQDIEERYGRDPDRLITYMLGLHSQFYYDTKIAKSGRDSKHDLSSISYKRKLINQFLGGRESNVFRNDVEQDDRDDFEKLCSLLLLYAKRNLLFDMKPQNMAQRKNNTVFKLVMNIASPYTVTLIEKFLRVHDQSPLSGQTSSAIAWKIATKALSEKKIALPPPVMGMRDMNFSENFALQELFIRFIVNTALSGFRWTLTISPLGETSYNSGTRYQVLTISVDIDNSMGESDRHFVAYQDMPRFRLDEFEVPHQDIPDHHKTVYEKIRADFQSNAWSVAETHFSKLDSDYGTKIGKDGVYQGIDGILKWIHKQYLANGNRYNFSLQLSIPYPVKMMYRAPQFIPEDYPQVAFAELTTRMTDVHLEMYIQEPYFLAAASMKEYIEAKIGDEHEEDDIFDESEKWILRIQMLWQDALAVIHTLGWKVDNSMNVDQDVADHDMSVSWNVLMANISKLLPLWSIMSGYGCLYVCKADNSDSLFSLRKLIDVPLRTNLALTSLQEGSWLLLQRHPLWRVYFAHNKMPMLYFKKPEESQRYTSIEPFYDHQKHWIDPRETKESFNNHKRKRTESLSP